MKDLTLLTRNGCVKAPAMVDNLNKALRALGWPKDYQIVNVSTLPTDDRRAGYLSPTVLYRDRDVFGMPVQDAAHAVSC